ncbi:UbiA family prenyltransferase [Engelhardtia mirabilis]|uniref:Prenyltransferase n=1 Tax=Engelhardtia mirabilis TaxID=2528011 RepID=A0A518BKQ6_9BACT|nr:prenyltransferase [Planctomycetes bacterium Pla133]QDV01886.1 prenyltransferase [Planctomycetes bacterium Pla86]
MNEARQAPPGWKSWGRVLRLSLTATAVADVAAGALLGAGAWPGGDAVRPAAPWLAILASLGVYHGGMALNDWADRDEDARVRPDRPIPSRAVDSRTVLMVAVLLLVGGPLIGAFASFWCGAAFAAVAACAALYDVAGRGPRRGPLLLGLCRFGNVGAGLLAGAAAVGGQVRLEHLVFPLVYALYVVNLSILGRLEDDTSREPGRAPAIALHVATLGLVLAPFAGALVAPIERGWLGDLAPWAGAALALSAAIGLQRAAARREPWTRPDVERAMGLLLRRLLILTASAVLASGAPGSELLALAILAGYRVSHQLRRLFPPS